MKETVLVVSDSPKALREALCMAQATLQRPLSASVPNAHHIAVISRLIQEIDVHRPLGPDGVHGDRHTISCGCEDKP